MRKPHGQQARPEHDGGQHQSEPRIASQWLVNTTTKGKRVALGCSLVLMQAKSNWVGSALLGAWLIFLWLEPEPRPLGAPEWIVAALRACTSLGEPAARLFATLCVRATGLTLLGALSMHALGAREWNRRSLAAVVGAPLLAIGVLWANLGYFPIALQLWIASVCAVTGAVGWLALQRRPFTAAGLALALAALFVWASATGIRDELDSATRAVGRQLLDAARGVPDGEAGHARLVELAFGIAESNSRGEEPVLANQAAILALSVVLGEEQVAGVARRDLDPARLPEVQALRERIALQGRKDWPQHFWVSAGRRCSPIPAVRSRSAWRRS